MMRTEDVLREYYKSPPVDAGAEERLREWVSGGLARRRNRRGVIAILGAVAAVTLIAAGIAWLRPRTDPRKRDVYVWADIGYGNGRCSRTWETRLARVDGAALGTIVTIKNPFGGSPRRLIG
jgi:hypothetical protein